jgi:hypothetical protein
VERIRDAAGLGDTSLLSGAVLFCSTCGWRLIGLFEELDFCATAMGDLSLRRRRILSLAIDVLEVKLGEEFLMSSLFTAGERALANLALAETDAPVVDVLVGGLGLGFTAAAALDDPRVRTLTVLEALQPVIDWHRRGLVPLGDRLIGDPRCCLRQHDFFAAMAPRRDDDATRYDAILLDIDHSPRALLNDRHRSFYEAEGLRGVTRRLRPAGVFAMWSDEGPDEAFLAALASVFHERRAEVVAFFNPLQNRDASCTIYIARGKG